MILPTKHIPTQQSLIGLGAVTLSSLSTPRTITALWDLVREEYAIRSFGQFALAVDFLFMIGAVEFDEGLLKKRL